MCDIIALPRKDYEGYDLIFEYDSELYYDVRIRDTRQGFAVEFVRMPFPVLRHKWMVNRMYAPYGGDSEAYGILDGDKLVAALELGPETHNRLRILNLVVDKLYRGRGYGRRLMDYAKEIAAIRGHRAIVLETQSCNAGAIGFYLSQGFTLAGFDAFAYSNEDVDHKEVRLEMACRLPKAGRA